MSDDTSKPDDAEAPADTEAPSDAEASAAPSSQDPPREKRAGKSKKRRERERLAAEAAKKSSLPNPLVMALLGVAAGAAAGWFGHVAQAKAKLKSDSPAPAASASAGAPKTGPCATFEKELCAKTGETSAACGQAKSASTLLTAPICEVALDAVPAMLAKVKAERAVCDTLVSKLCKDLGPDSGACGMVKEKTPSFPSERCVELNKNYDGVLSELRQMEQQGAIPGTPQAPGVRMPPGMPQHGGPPGMPPQGGPPGMPPQGGPPGGAHGPGDGHDH